MTINLQQPSEGHGESASMLDGVENFNFDDDVSNSNSAISALLEYDQINNPKVCSSGDGADDLKPIAELHYEGKTATDVMYDSINNRIGETIGGGEHSIGAIQYGGGSSTGVLPIVLQPNENDVLLNWGAIGDEWSGNEKFRTFASEMCSAYVDSSKQDKSAIISTLLTKIRTLQPPGRFLKQEFGVWYEAHDVDARARASQCLRDMAAVLSKGGIANEKPKNKEAMKSTSLLNQSINQANHGRGSSSNSVTSNARQLMQSNSLEKGLPIFDIRADFLYPYVWFAGELKQMIRSDTISDQNIANVIVQQFIKRFPTVKDKFDCYKILVDFLNLFDDLPKIPIISKTDILDECMKRLTASNIDNLIKMSSMYQRKDINMIVNDGKFDFKINESSIIRNSNSDWIPIGIMATNKEFPLNVMNSYQLGFFVRNRFSQFVDKCPLMKWYFHFILENYMRLPDSTVIRCPCGRIRILFQDNGVSRLNDDDLGNFVLISYKGSRHNQPAGGGCQKVPCGELQSPTVMKPDVQQPCCEQTNAMTMWDMAQQQHYKVQQNQWMGETNVRKEPAKQEDTDRQSLSQNYIIDLSNSKCDTNISDKEYFMDTKRSDNNISIYPEEPQSENEDKSKIESISNIQVTQSPSDNVDLVISKCDTSPSDNENMVNQEETYFKNKGTNKIEFTQDKKENLTPKMEHQANSTFNGQTLFNNRQSTYTSVFQETHEGVDLTMRLLGTSKVAAFNTDNQCISSSSEWSRKRNVTKDEKTKSSEATPDPEIKEQRNLLRRIEALHERTTIHRELKRLRLSPQLILEASDPRRFSKDELVSSNQKLKRYITDELQRQVWELENDLEDDFE